MEFDPKAVRSGQAVIQRLERYNPWWESPREGTLTGEYSSLLEEFHKLYDQLHTENCQLLSLTGPPGSGKSTLLEQLVSAHIDSNFIEKFFREPDRRDVAHDRIVPPTNVCYIPLHDTALFQLYPEEQLRATIDHFETHVFREVQTPVRYLFIDDVHTLERPNTRGTSDIGQWENVLTELSSEQRRIVFTALSKSQVVERLERITDTSSSQDLEPANVDLYPLGFRDFLRMRHRDIQLTPSSERLNECAIGLAFRQAVNKNDHTIVLEEIETQHNDAVIEPSVVRREIANYCTAGGLLGLRFANDVDIEDEQFVDILRGRGEPALEHRQTEMVEEFRAELLRATTKLGRVKDPTGIERFCALAAHTHPSDDVLFDELTDVLGVDRRTIRNKYLGVLSQLQLLSAAEEYDNQRPRKLRFYLRDPGLICAFCGYDLNDVLRREPRLDEILAKVSAFDGTIRLSARLNNEHDPKRGVVKFWPGTRGSVDFVLKIDGRPVPILWSYNRDLDELRRRVDTPGFDALREFLNGDAYRSERDSVDEAFYSSLPESVVTRRQEYVQQKEYRGRYDADEQVVFDGEPPFGMVLTNSREALEDGVFVYDEGPKPVVQIPLWTYLRLT